MGKRDRKRRRVTAAAVTPAPVTEPPAGVPEEPSGLLTGQTDPAIREILTGISRRLRAQYGTPGGE